MTDYLRLTKLCEQRRLRRYANRDNGHRPARVESPLTKAVRFDGQAFMARLNKAIHEALK